MTTVAGDALTEARLQGKEEDYTVTDVLSRHQLGGGPNSLKDAFQGSPGVPHVLLLGDLPPH